MKASDTRGGGDAAKDSRARRVYGCTVRVDATTTVDCPPETVFDSIADARNEPRWNSRVSSSELRSPEPIGLGSEFTIVNSGTSYDVTITTYDRPNRVVF